MSNQSQTAPAGGLHTGTKVALMAAAGFLATAAYFFMTPTHFLGKDGGIFGCGSPMSPNDSQLGKSQCSMLETVSRDRALLFLALAILSGLLGFLFFGNAGGAKKTRTPRALLEDERSDEDGDDHVEDRPSSARRPRLGDEDDAAGTAPVVRENTTTKQRTRLVDVDDDAPTRRRGRYDDEAFDSARD